MERNLLRLNYYHTLSGIETIITILWWNIGMRIKWMKVNLLKLSTPKLHGQLNNHQGSILNSTIPVSK